MGIVSPSREAVFEALLAQCRTAGEVFKTYTRRWQSIWDDPNAELAPLPMLVQWDQNEANIWTNRGIGSPHSWEVTIQIYAKIPPAVGELDVPDKLTPGSSVINPLLDALEAALAPVGPDGVQTLGDLVLDCRIEGLLVNAYGDEDPSGLCGALVPIKILLL